MEDVAKIGKKLESIMKGSGVSFHYRSSAFSLNLKRILVLVSFLPNIIIYFVFLSYIYFAIVWNFIYPLELYYCSKMWK